jgi:hypothetical protein
MPGRLSVMVTVGVPMGQSLKDAEANPEASVDDIANLAAARQCGGAQVSPCKRNVCPDRPEWKQCQYQTEL